MTLEEIREFPPVRLEDPGPSGIWPYPRRRDDHRPARPGPRDLGRHGAGRAHAGRRIRQEVVDHRTYVLASDGDLMEGICQEAIAIAGHLKLNRLIVLWDDNGISIDGPLSVSTRSTSSKRFEPPAGRPRASTATIRPPSSPRWRRRRPPNKPTLIACRTVIGFGAPTRAGKSKAHGEPLGAEELAGTKAALNWPHAPFEIPADLLAAWRNAGRAAQGAGRMARQVDAWRTRQRDEFLRRLEGRLPTAGRNRRGRKAPPRRRGRPSPPARRPKPR